MTKAKKTTKEDKEKSQEKDKSQDKTHSSFLGKLKSTCENCKPASILVYFRNVKRLYRLIEEEGDIPPTGTWLGKKTLLEKYKKLDLKVRRHLSVAGVKASKAYKRNADDWTVQMYKDASAYERGRSKNKRSKKEIDSWPKGGFKAVKRAASEMWKRVKVLLGKDEVPNLTTLYKYQLFIVLKLFSEIPFRNLFATFSIKKSDGNYIERPKKGNWKLIVNQHKSLAKQGPKEVALSRANTMALRKFLKYRGEVEEVKHDYLLSNKTGTKMSKATMGKAVHRVTKELLGKAFGSRLIRVLASTELKPEIDKIEELREKMLHAPGSKQTKGYTRKT